MKMSDRSTTVPAGLILPKYAALQESVRYKSQEYYGLNVRIDKMSDESGALMMSLKSQFSDKSLKRWQARKNKNPLRTSMTVKQLKNLITTINKDSAKTSAPALICSSLHSVDQGQKGKLFAKPVSGRLSVGYPTSKDVSDYAYAYDSGLLATAMHLSCLDTPRTLALGSDGNGAAPASELEQAAKAKPRRRSAARQRSFDIQVIEIGSFNVVHIERTPQQHKLKINFTEKCIIYEFQCDCLVQENAWTPPDLVHVNSTMLVPFEIIKSMCFLEFELWMRVSLEQ